MNWKPPIREIQSPSGIFVPERTIPPEESFLTAPKETEAWIASLPTANIGETSRQIYQALTTFNRLEIPDLTRIKIAELFRRPISYLTANLDKHFVESPFPLSSKNKKIAALSRELHTELAISYKILIANALAGSGAGLDRKLIAITLHRAIACLSRGLLQSSLIYSPPSPDTWKEIYTLYSFAERNQLHQFPVKDAIDEPADNTTVADMFKRVLLFSLASPCRLRQREIKSLFQALPEWAGLTTLQKTSADTKKKGTYLINLASDTPPSHLTGCKENNGQCHVLDPRKLVSHLAALIEEKPQPPKLENTLSDDPVQSFSRLLRQLIRSWNAFQKRRFARSRLSFELKIAAGFGAVHALLSKALQEQENAKREKPKELHWLGNRLIHSYDTDEPERDQASPEKYSLTPFSLDLERDGASFNHDLIPLDSEVRPTWAANPSPQRFEFFNCVSNNECVEGYCVDWQGMDAPRIKVGELIGIPSPSDNTRFNLGIARWMTDSPNDGLAIGIEIIAPSCTPVDTRVIGGGRQGKTYRCLLLPTQTNPSTPPSLIVPAPPYHVGDVLWLKEGKKERRIRLTELLESTGAFHQFGIAFLNRDGSEAFKRNVEDETDFGTIWSAF